MNILVRLALGLAVWLWAVPFLVAQPAFRHNVLALAPDDFAICVVLHDLRGQSARWQQSDWLKQFEKSPLAKTMLESPEMKQLGRWHDELKKHLDQLPLHLRQKLLPLAERLHHYTRLHSRLLRIAQEAVDQMQLDMKYLQFDLEATRRERDELIREIRGPEEELN